MIKNLKNKKKGFTLIELIIVIAIIAILAAVAIPKFGEVRKNANVKADIANAKTIAGAVSTLLAEEKLLLTDGKVINAAGFIIDNSGEDTTSDVVVTYLQAAPKGKHSTNKGKSFWAKVDANGGVTVYLGDSISGGQLVYPGVATGDYSIN